MSADCGNFVKFSERDVAQRLRDNGTFRDVGLSADIAALEAARGLISGGAYVLLAGDNGSTFPDSKAIEHQMDVQFGVVLIARNYRISKGESDADALQEMRHQCRQAIAGWQPPGCDLPVECDGGQLVKYTAELLIWVERFTTQYQFSATRQPR